MWNEIKQIQSSDQNVKKYVFSSDSAVAESVLYKYPTYKDRTVICCSTQSGCPMGCRFCGAGDNFVRNLSAEEIISQPSYLLEQTGIDPLQMGRLQIMFMSMGEPLMNTEGLFPSLYKLNEKYPNAALLISTSAPKTYEAFRELRKISQDIPQIGLQFSVHESTDEARKKLIPAPTMTLREISEEGEHWGFFTGRRPFFNYCVHEKNNSIEDVKRLEKHFDPNKWEATISVICERDENIAAANDRQRELASNFMSLMINSGYSTRMFDPAGQDDIGGGCGQLWFVQQWIKENSSKAKHSIGHKLPIVHTPRI